MQMICNESQENEGQNYRSGLVYGSVGNHKFCGESESKQEVLRYFSRLGSALRCNSPHLEPNLGVSTLIRLT